MIILVGDNSIPNLAKPSGPNVNIVNSNVLQQRGRVPEFNGTLSGDGNDTGLLEAFVGGVAAHYNSAEFTVRPSKHAVNVRYVT